MNDKKSISTMFALAAWLWAPGGFASAQEPKLLRWQFESGDQYTVQLMQDVTQTVTAPSSGRTAQSRQIFTFDITWDVQEVQPDGQASVIQTIRRVQASLQAPGGAAVRYDTRSASVPQLEPAKRLAAMFKPLVDVPFQQIVTPRGQLVDVEPGHQPQGENAPLSNPGLADVFRKTLPVLPKEPVKPGFQWQDKLDSVSPLGKTNILMSFTYAGQERKLAKPLDRLDLTFTLEVAENLLEATGKTEISISAQDNSGRVYFDAVAGYLVGTQLFQNMTLSIVEEETKITQKLESKVKLIMTPTQ